MIVFSGKLAEIKLLLGQVIYERWLVPLLHNPQEVPKSEHHPIYAFLLYKFSPTPSLKLLINTKRFMSSLKQLSAKSQRLKKDNAGIRHTRKYQNRR